MGGNSSDILERGKNLKEKAEKIKIIVLDIDGTMTDGRIHIDENRIEMKSFDVKDGFAIAQAIEYGLIFAIITGRQSPVVDKRAAELKIKEVHQAVKNKLEKLQEILKKYSINPEETAYIGDDINDIPAMKICGLKAVPADGADEVKEIADIVCKKNGGRGAVRELLEIILKSKGIWKDILQKYDF